MPEKYLLKSEYFQGDKILDTYDPVSYMPIQHLINEDGVMAIFCNEYLTLWEGKMDNSKELILKYEPDVESNYFHLFFFTSTNALNIRVNTDLLINEHFINNQLLSGSVFLNSNVGLELMIPPNTKIDFQFASVNKSLWQNFIYTKCKDLPPLILSLINSNVEVCFISKEINHFQNQIPKIRTLSDIQQHQQYIFDKLTRFLDIKNNICREELSFWDFYKILSIEQQISNLSAVTKSIITELGSIFSYSYEEIYNNFEIIFGNSIYNYHVITRMKYALFMLEEQKMSVLEVSEKMGFKSVQMFRQTFKRYYSEPPRAFKSKNN